MTGSGRLGAEALPVPAVDSVTVRDCAAALRRVSAAALRTDVVRGRVGPALGAVWGGSAASAAVAEAETLAGRAQSFIGRLPTSAQALERYADAADEATSHVRRLQLRWDEAEHEHRRAVSAAASAAVLDPALHAGTLTRLQADHGAVLAALEGRYERCLADLRHAGAVCALALHATSTASFARARGTAAADVRPGLLRGLPMAEGAVRALEARERAREAAAAWRLLGPEARPEEVRSWVHRHSGLAHDPLFAQSLVSEVGVEEMLTALTEIAMPGRPATAEDIRALAGVLGTLVLTAAAPGVPARTDARTRRQLVLDADPIRRELVDVMGTEIATADGFTRHGGAWLVGQLLVGAREAGANPRLPVALLRDLAAAAAAAEIAESNDIDMELRHGTTLAADGYELFASWFEDANETGDTLHQLLVAASDPRDQREMLAATLPQTTLRNSRGDDLILAEYLVRRWITHNTNGHAEFPTEPLATSADLLRIMAEPADDDSGELAALRARVMAELGRTSALARADFVTTMYQERHGAPLETVTLGWLLAMRESVDRTLADPSEVTPDVYSTVIEDDHHPSLLLAELTGLVGAYAAGTDFTLRGKAPDATFEMLQQAELDNLREHATRGGGVGPALTRIAYYNQVASAALVERAEQRDRANKQMWEVIAEFKNVILYGRSHPVGLAEGVITSGTTRSAADDLVISVIRSNVLGEQAEANEARDAALARRLDAILRAEASCPLRPAGELLASGARLAPDTPSSAEVEEARWSEIGGHLLGVIEEQVPVDASTFTSTQR